MIKNKYLTQMEKTLDLYFGKKAPPIPENIKEYIVKFSPYLVILSLVLNILNYFPLDFSFMGILFISTLVLLIMAIPGLLKRTRQSWDYLFYVSLISLLSNLLSLNLSSLIIGGIISFYLLFQIKSYYKN
jgi:hypothetical protein